MEDRPDPVATSRTATRPDTMLPGPGSAPFSGRSFSLGFGPARSRTLQDSLHLGFGNLSPLRRPEPFLWLLLCCAGRQDRGVSKEDAGGLLGHQINHDGCGHRGASCTQRLQGTRIGEAARPGPIHRNKATQITNEPRSPKRTHSKSSHASHETLLLIHHHDGPSAGNGSLLEVCFDCARGGALPRYPNACPVRSADILQDSRARWIGKRRRRSPRRHCPLRLFVYSSKAS